MYPIRSLNRLLFSIRRASNGWTVSSLLLSLLILLPVGYILLSLFSPASDIWQHVWKTLLADYISNTLLLLLGVSVISLVLGVSSAWMVTQYQFPGRRIFRWALIMPLSLPTYIIAFTYAGIFDYTGTGQHLYRAIFGSTIDIKNIYWLMPILALGLYPYVYIISRTTFAVQSRQLLQASESLGKSSWYTFRKIALPLARPAIIGGLGLVVMELLNDYGAVKYFGVPTFTTGIFRVWFSMGDINAAIRLSACLLIFVVGLMAIERWQRGKVQVAGLSTTDRKTDRLRAELKGWKMAFAIVVCALPVLFGFIIPVMQLTEWSAQTFHKVVNADFWQLTANSFLLALGAAVVCVLAGLLINFANKWKKTLVLRGLSKLATVGYALPGAVIAVGIMVPGISLDKYINQQMGSTGLLLSGSFFLLVSAYLIRFLAVSYNAIDSSFKKLPQNITDASMLLGGGSFKTLFKIHLPLIRGGLLAAGLLVFVDIMKELPLTLILRPFNFDTLATKAFELASDEQLAQSANAALIIVITGLIPIFVLNKLLSRSER